MNISLPDSLKTFVDEQVAERCGLLVGDRVEQVARHDREDTEQLRRMGFVRQ